MGTSFQYSLLFQCHLFSTHGIFMYYHHNYLEFFSRINFFSCIRFNENVDRAQLEQKEND